jgi:hypothetical protein
VRSFVDITALMEPRRQAMAEMKAQAYLQSCGSDEHAPAAALSNCLFSKR